MRRVVALTILAGCALPPTESASTALEPAPLGAPAADDGRIAEPPTARTALATALRAYHPTDLPSSTDLRSIDRADAHLIGLSQTAPTLLERSRALSLLRHVPTERSRDRLVVVLRSRAHPKLLAAAILGALGSPEDPQLQAAVDALGGHPDPRVQRARDRFVDGHMPSGRRWPVRNR